MHKEFRPFPSALHNNIILTLHPHNFNDPACQKCLHTTQKKEEEEREKEEEEENEGKEQNKTKHFIA